MSGVPPLGAYAARRCPVRVQLDHDVEAGGLPRVVEGEAARRRMDAGVDFEQRVFSLVSDGRPGAVRIAAGHRDLAPVATLAAMRDGAEVVVGGDLPDDVDMRRRGRPDLLVHSGAGWVPVDIKHHRLTDPKDGESLPCSTLDGPLDPADAGRVDGVRFRRDRLADDALQLAHYWRMLERHGLAAPGTPTAGLVGRDERIWWVDLAAPIWTLWWSPEPVGTLAWYDHEFAFRLDVVAHTLRRNQDRSLPPKVVPVWTAECTSCPWRQVCRGELEAADHVSLLPRSTYAHFVWHRRRDRLTRRAVAELDPTTAWVMHGDRSASSKVDVAGLLTMAADVAPDTPIPAVIGKRKRTAVDRLAQAGVRTAGDVAKLDAATAAYEGAAVGHLPTIIDWARAATSGRPWRARGVDRVEVPRADVEVDIDMESNEDGVYLWGTWVAGDDGHPDGYIPFVSWEPLTPEAEAAVFTDLWACLGATRDRAHAAGRSFAAYYYTSAENTQMRRIVDRGQPGLPSREDIEAFIAAAEWVDLHAVLSTQLVTGHGVGLKAVAPLAGFHWRDDDPGGDQSTVWYERAVADPGG
ncbi:MAG TPA: hypothetical protein VGG23_02405, partial [Acidimicrobiales bacterium]